MEYIRTPHALAIAFANAGATGLKGAFTHRFRAERPELVVRVGKQYFGDRQIPDLGNVIIAQLRIDHPTFFDDDLLRQRSAERLSHTAFHLPAQLCRVHDGAGIGGLNRLQDLHPAGVRVDGNAKTVNVERDRARCPVVATVSGERATFE